MSTIRDLIPYELAGTVDLVLAPQGVRCRLELPADCLTNDRESASEIIKSKTGTPTLEDAVKKLAG